MNCTKCNGSGSEGYISSFRCDRCGGTGKEPVSLAERDTTALSKNYSTDVFKTRIKRLREEYHRISSESIIIFGALSFFASLFGEKIGLLSKKNPFDK